MTPRPPQEPQPTDKQLQGKAIARAKLEAMHARARRIRRYVAGTAGALFVAAFLGVYVQLASGHDPALVAASKRTSTSSSSLTASSSKGSTEESSGSGESSSTEPETSSGESSSSTESESSSGESSSSTGEEASSESPSSVTTSQS